MAAEGFHEGELAVQRRAGVVALAARLGSAMLATPDLSGGVGIFLEGRDFAVMACARRRPPLVDVCRFFASPGFLEARDRDSDASIHARSRRSVQCPCRWRAGRSACHRIRHPAQSPGERHSLPTSAPTGLRTDRRPGIRQLPQVYSTATSRTYRSPPSCGRAGASVRSTLERTNTLP